MKNASGIPISRTLVFLLGALLSSSCEKPQVDPNCGDICNGGDSSAYCIATPQCDADGRVLEFDYACATGNLTEFPCEGCECWDGTCLENENGRAVVVWDCAQ